jgi:hypothetical protein
VLFPVFRAQGIYLRVELRSTKMDEESSRSVLEWRETSLEFKPVPEWLRVFLEFCS